MATKTKKITSLSTSPPTRRQQEQELLAEEWSPSILNAWRLFLAVQICSAFFNYISDCDEVFNYWEPLHFMQHGRGLQTWEYRSAPLTSCRV